MGTNTNKKLGPSAFGKLVKGFRTRFGLSRERFAAEATRAGAKCCSTTIRGWERYHREPLPGYRDNVERYMVARSAASDFHRLGVGKGDLE